MTQSQTERARKDNNWQLRKTKCSTTRSFPSVTESTFRWVTFNHHLLRHLYLKSPSALSVGLLRTEVLAGWTSAMRTSDSKEPGDTIEHTWKKKASVLCTAAYWTTLQYGALAHYSKVYPIKCLIKSASNIRLPLVAVTQHTLFLCVVAHFHFDRRDSVSNALMLVVRVVTSLLCGMRKQLCLFLFFI